LCYLFFFILKDLIIKFALGPLDMLGRPLEGAVEKGFVSFRERFMGLGNTRVKSQLENTSGEWNHWVSCSWEGIGKWVEIWFVLGEINLFPEYVIVGLNWIFLVLFSFLYSLYLLNHLFRLWFWFTLCS